MGRFDDRSQTSIARKTVATLLLFATVPLAVGDVIRVDVNASNGGDGSTWALGYNSLQAALVVATSGDEIWVADGTYYPSAQTDPNEPRSATFSLANGVAIYGGFRGIDNSDPNSPFPGESSRSQRNPERYETVLSGNIQSPSSTQDNCFHVVTADTLNSTAVLNGFTIRDGVADVSGNFRGGGMYSINSTPQIVRCVFRENTGAEGGALYILRPSSGFAEFVNCSFIENSATYYGGAAYPLHARVNWTNCQFIGNSAGDKGGAIMIEEHDVDSIINCTFSQNTADEGDALWVYLVESTDIAVKNSIVWGNSQAPIHVDVSGTGGSFTVSYSNIEGSSVYTGSGNILSDPLFCNANAGRYQLQDGSPCIGAGNNGALPADVADLNEDADPNQPIPWDAAKSVRVFPVSGGTVDMGAFENQHNPDCPADLDGSGAVGIADLAILLGCYGLSAEGSCASSDLDCTGDVGVGDLSILLSAYGTCGGDFAGGGEEAEFFEWAQSATIDDLLAWYYSYRDSPG